MPASVMWFRRDLRLADHPALAAAARDRRHVVGLFVLDPVLLGRAKEREAFMHACLEALASSVRGALLVETGDAREVVPRVARRFDADEVHVTAEFTPYAVKRDLAVAARLESDGRRLVRTGSSYAVPPGEVLTAQQRPFRVFTPYSRAWIARGWDAPTGAPRVRWVAVGPWETRVAGRVGTGERAAARRAATFLRDDLPDYARDRDFPGLDGTSRLSAHLRWGTIHPRQLLAELDDSAGATRFRLELAWREFYADVLHHEPESAWRPLQPRMASFRVDTDRAAKERFDRWCTGTTGFPIVDAGMRQLLTEGWMHNRIRMITASFLVKDLHLPWQWGARFFLDHLIDGDLASNNHGWQWVAGTGTDPAPFFRIFNPTVQSRRFDPDGEYIRSYVPELAAVTGKAIHEPSAAGAVPLGYVQPMVDHASEREEALRRYSETGA